MNKKPWEEGFIPTVGTRQARRRTEAPCPPPPGWRWTWVDDEGVGSYICGTPDPWTKVRVFREGGWVGNWAVGTSTFVGGSILFSSPSLQACFVWVAVEGLEALVERTHAGATPIEVGDHVYDELSYATYSPTGRMARWRANIWK